MDSDDVNSFECAVILFIVQSINLNNSKRVQQVKVRPHQKAVRHNARQLLKNQRKYNSPHPSQNYRLIYITFISKIRNAKDVQGSHWMWKTFKNDSKAGKSMEFCDFS